MSIQVDASHNDVDVKRTYLRLLRYTLPFKISFAISFFGFALFALSQLGFAMLMQLFMEALEGSTVRGLYFVPLTCVAIAFLRGVGGYLGAYYMGKVGAGVVHSVRCDLFSNLIYLPLDFYDKHKTGNLISLFTYNATALTDSVTRAVTIIVREGLTVIALFGYMVYLNWSLTLIFLMLGPVLGLAISWVGRHVKRLGKGLQVSMGDINHVANELLGSVRLVKGSVAEQAAIERFADVSNRTRKLMQKMTKVSAIFTPMMQMLVIMALAIVMYVVLMLADTMPTPQLLAYMVAAATLPKPIRSLGEVYSRILQGVVAAEQIFQHADAEREKRSGSVDANAVAGDIEFKQVSFRYNQNQEQVLDSISFHAKTRSTTALVGKSGSGKTTLAALLPRFYDRSSGDLLIDGVAIEDYQLDSLRQKISLVSQNVTLFNDTVTANIAYGRSAYCHDDVVAAATAANAHEFIEALPQGYDTVVGENGELLSGGQRQRIAIARAILRDTPILILDEATSALDNESEVKVQQALDRVMTDRTTLVIAHRLSTVERADNILVLDRGCIVEQGCHDELMAQGGVYARMVMRNFDDAPV